MSRHIREHSAVAPMNRSFYFDTALLPDGWSRDVHVLVRDGLIESVRTDGAALAGEERAALAVPGLPNVHSHAFQRAMAGLTEQRGPHSTDDFWSWRELMYRFLARLDADELEVIAAYAYADMLEAGFTSVGEFHYLHRPPQSAAYTDPAELALRHLAAADATGIGLTLLPVFYEASDFGGAAPKLGQRRFLTDLDAYADIVERVRAAMGNRLGRSVGVAPHSLRAVAPDHLAALLRLYPDGIIHIHAAEQLKEVNDCIAWSGRRPVEWLLENAALDARWCLVHATHLTATECAALARSGAVAGLCPITEANLGDGTFPAAPFMAAGGHWGIGTDSNIQIDAAGELRQLEYAQRLSSHTRNALSTPERPSTGRVLFQSALAGGAQALGQRVGLIAPGYRADLLVLDERHPDLAGRSGDAVLDTWIFAGGRALIREVIAAGETVVEQHRHRARDRIDRAYRDVAARLIQSPTP
jgi:formimidoylglutamate deiminase